MRRFLILCLAAQLATAASKKALDRIVTETPALARAHWGVLVVNARTGKTVYSRNAQSYFVPASNTKLFSTALALSRLGPDHRMTTRVVAEAAPDGAGTVTGNLYLVGGGDTSLSPRAFPYKKGTQTEGAFAAMEALADAVVAKGVKRITGDVVGDDSAYGWEPYPPGWAMDDATWEYGAPVSALIVNDNTLWLEVKPGAKAGAPALLTFDPPFPFFQLENRVVTGTRSGYRFSRQAGSSTLTVSGGIATGAEAQREQLAIEEPALFAARVLADALMRRGVRIDGAPAVRHRLDATTKPVDGVELTRRESPKLKEILQVVDKVSQNLHAEIALRETARVKTGAGLRQAGLEELKQFLKEAGVDEHAYTLSDGSGLSRLNLLTPDTIVKLLRFMDASPHRAEWLEMLPIGGEDGTLRTRFVKTEAAGRVRAKTGSLSHVSALSGYLERPKCDRYVFSILVNNYEASTKEVRAAMDKLLVTLLK